MDVNSKFGYFLENLGNPFMVGSLITNKTFYINKQATELFGITTDNCDLGKVFDRAPDRIQSLMVKALKQSKPTLVYNYTANTKDDKKILVDLQVGYFNDEKTEVFLEIIPQIDKRLELALHQIQNSPRAEAILNLDEKLSIVDCNEAFLKVFEASEELRHSHFKNDLVNGFLPELRESLVADIHKTLEISDIFSTELKVFTTNGEEHWYRFDLQKRELDSTGTKLMCYMVNIEKQIEVKENFDLLNQYLSVVQESTVDLLYRVDITTNTMYSYHEFQSITDSDRVIPDYVNTFFDKDTVHPDDKEIYLKGFKNFHENDIPCEDPIRFSLGGRPYKWYKITAKKIFDNEGNLKEVFGTLVNVDNEVNMKGEVTTLQKYFDVLQEFTDDILYRVDVSTKTLHHAHQRNNLIKLDAEIPNYLETLLETKIIHPDDAETFLDSTKKWHEDETVVCDVRLSLFDENYLWYSVKRRKVFDETGKLVEIIGALVNIHKEYTIKKENKTLNQYFDVLQTIPHESFYSVDVKNKTLTQKGQVAEELGLVQKTANFPESILNKVHPYDLDIYKNYSYSSMRGMSGQAEVRVQTKTGKFQWYRLQCEIVHDENGDIAEVVGKMNNVQKEKELGENFASLNHIFTAFQKLSEDILFRIDVKTGSMYQTGDAETAQALGKEIPDYVNTLLKGGVIHVADTDTFRKFTSDILKGAQKECQVRVATTPTNYDWFQITVEPFYDENKNLLDIFGKMVNIQRKKDLERNASHDLMTNVLNKVSFEKESREVLQQSNTTMHHALIFVDLDDFKGVNDTYGHGFGDFLLTTVSKRLKRVVREHDLVGRLGGDEFSLLLKSIGTPESAESRVNLLLETLNRPFSYDGKTVEIKASIGFAIYPLHGSDYKELIGKADMALYSSKGKGKNVATMYTEELEEY